MSQKSKPLHRGKRTPYETLEPTLRQAALRKLTGRTAAKGELWLPAIPALADHYTQLINATFMAVGRAFSAAELEHLRGVLTSMTQKGYEISPYCKISVSYETDAPPSSAIRWVVNLCPSTIEDQYAEWVQTRAQPLFGEHPDAKPMALAKDLGEPSDCPILDIGAGTGRNALPLVRLGYPTDAVELAPALASLLREAADAAKLAIRVFECDILASNDTIPRSFYRLAILSEVVAHFRSVEQLRRLFEVLAELLVPGGCVVFSAFLAAEGYKPDEFVRQMSQMQWCTVFTRGQLQDAVLHLPFELVSNESCQEFEREHLSAECWPPTGWYETWTSGCDLFDLPPGRSPIEMRWLVYRRK